jgi:hypothetical protein
MQPGSVLQIWSASDSRRPSWRAPCGCLFFGCHSPYPVYAIRRGQLPAGAGFGWPGEINLPTQIKGSTRP